MIHLFLLLKASFGGYVSRLRAASRVAYLSRKDTTLSELALRVKKTQKLGSKLNIGPALLQSLKATLPEFLPSKRSVDILHIVEYSDAL